MLLPAGATAAAVTCLEAGLVETDSERAAALVQEFCRAQAAFEAFEDGRLALLHSARVEADRALERLQREHGRAQALVSMNVLMVHHPSLYLVSVWEPTNPW